ERARAIADRVKNHKGERKRFLDLQDTYQYNQERKRLRIGSSLNVERAVNKMIKKSINETILIHKKNLDCKQPGVESEDYDQDSKDGKDDEELRSNIFIRPL
ncbi:7230_t:CDS:2, partial [Funneliformis caledonium]